MVPSPKASRISAFPYTTSPDLESGSPTSPGSQVWAARRFLARRAKWLLGGTLLFATFLWLKGDVGGGGGGPGPPPGWPDFEAEDEGWGWKPFKHPPPPPRPPFLDDDDDWRPPPSSSSSSGALDYITPMHPDLSLLPPPADLFPEITSLRDFLRPPASHIPFPPSELRKVVDPDAPPFVLPPGAELPAESFAREWVGPEGWEEKGEVRKVQWSGFKGGRDQWESKEERAVRTERRDAVRRGFVWAWQGYKDYAWGHDEVKPVSKEPSDPFNNWGASIVDTLDTLLLMGLSDEYNLCRPHVNQLNFHWHNGRDWSAPFTSGPDEETGQVFNVPRERNVGLPVFETGIRYLGGMLGAYDLSGDKLLLERSVDLAGILGRAFETQSGLPAGRIDPGHTDGPYRLGTVSVAEVGSMSLELIRLAQITGDRKWFDMAQRAMDYLNERVIPRAVTKPLIPMWFQADAGMGSPLAGGLTFGGLADSYYEYLIKTYKLLGGNEISKVWRETYEGSIDAARTKLYVDIDVVPGLDILALGKFEAGRLIPEIEHLTCFAGAMLGLGSRLLSRTQDMVDAERLTASCYWLSAATPTGLQPEVVEFFPPGSGAEAYHNVTLEGKPYHPGVASHADGAAKKLMHMDRQGVWRWNDDQRLVRDDELDSGKGEAAYVERLRGVPVGSKKVVPRGINRPETIESIFYMYRLTGDRKWQEKGWKMFVSWMTVGKAPAGVSSVADVTKENFVLSDNMESFAFAETFKYHFLLQSEPDVLSLDDYVLNTEAHPFLTNPNLSPGASNLWHPSAAASRNLGVRGQGTDAQKWVRANVLYKAMHPLRGGPAGGGGNGGGGRGMGGGGGNPNVRPKPDW